MRVGTVLCCGLLYRKPHTLRVRHDRSETGIRDAVRKRYGWPLNDAREKCL